MEIGSKECENIVVLKIIERLQWSFLKKKVFFGNNMLFLTILSIYIETDYIF